MTRKRHNLSILGKQSNKINYCFETNSQTAKAKNALLQVESWLLPESEKERR